MRLIRKYIRMLLESEVLGEPDESAEDLRDESEEDEQAAAPVPGAQVPLGAKSASYPDDDSKKKKRKK